MSRWALVALLAAAGSAGCSKAPSEDECKSLLDHLVDLEFKKSGAATGDKASVIDAKLTAGFIETCTSKMPKSRIQCALNAADLDTGVTRCDEGK